MTINLPAEWAEQDAVLLTWPHAQSDWASCLQTVTALYIELAQQLSRYVTVIISVPCDQHASITQQVGQQQHYPIVLYPVSSNDTWARDHGPITVLKHGQAQLLDFTFNAWGNKFLADVDNRISATLHQLGAFGQTPITPLDFILEGGAIESDGNGTILTTAACLLNPNRNPNMSQACIEQQLKMHLGTRKVNWLHHGYLAGDDTDSHIDTLARLCPDNIIAYVQCKDPHDEHYVELKAMEAELQQLSDADGKPYSLVPLPWPKAICNDDGERLPATYANFLITNGAVFVPLYNDASDHVAIATIQSIFTHHKIIGINCLSLIQQGGSLHCITMQLPRGVIH